VQKAIKQRKGFTMLETVVSFAMFSVVLLLVLGTSYMSFNFSHFVANTAVDIAKTRSTVNYIQRTFESAQRMQYDNVVPSTATSAVVQSITFKRSAGASDYWTDLTVSGTALKSGNITLLNSASNILVDFYSPAGLLLASNHANVPVIPNFNDKGWEYYKVRYITMLNNDYFPITAVRKVSPYFEAPYVTDFTDSSRYTFSLPLDTTKKVGSLNVTYTSNSNVVNSDATASVINANINAFSSYLGIPAKKSAQITITPNPTASTTDYALYFDGVDDYMYGSVINNVTFGSQFTIEMLVNISPSMANNGAVLFSISRTKTDYTNEALLMLIPTGQGAKLRFWDYSTTYGFPDNSNNLSTVVLQPNQTYHIAFVKNGLTGTYYVNGQSAGTITAAVDVHYGNDSVYLGSNFRDNNLYYSGYMDEVRIWNTARTQTQIQTYMNKKLTGQESGLAVYWDFDENITATSVFDLTGNCLDGMLYNGLHRVPFEAFPFNWVVTLTDKLTNTPITGATVYAYDSNGHFNQYITDEDGSFRIGDYSGFSSTDITFFHPGDETYAPATARY